MISDVMGKGIRNRRAAVAAVTAAMMLAAPAAALASGQKSDSQSHRGKNGPAATTAAPAYGSSQSTQGVVQSVGSTAVVLRQLDGSSVAVPVDRKTTQVFVNGKHAQWSDVKPGYVLTAAWKAGKPAPVLRFARP
jgi:hypothetical protein